MSNKQQAPAKMPLYNNADFTCGRCESVWKADYTDLARLRNNQAIACKNCQCELLMNDDELQLLNDRFKQAEKLSRTALYFAIPYFIVCAVVGFLYSGVITVFMIIAGFMILMTMRSSLTKDGIDHFHLKSTPQELTDTNTVNKTPKKFKKKKKKKKTDK